MYLSKFIFFGLIDPFFANLYRMTPFLQICTQWPQFYVYFGVYLSDDSLLKTFVPNDPIFIPVLFWMTPIFRNVQMYRMTPTLNMDETHPCLFR